MRRLAALVFVLAAFGSAAAAMATTTTAATRSCSYTPRRGAFPDVQHLVVANGACATADQVAASIQRYWRAHATSPPDQALPPRAGGFACHYRLRHEPTRDPYYVATCRRAGAEARMALTS